MNTQTAEDRPLWPSLQQIAGTIASAGSVLIIVGYAVIRTQYANFYRPLGLSPDDVGLDVTTTLGNALPLVGLGFVLVLDPLLGLMFAVTVSRWMVGKTYGGVFRVAILVAFFALVVIGGLVVKPLDPGEKVMVLLVGYFFLGYFIAEIWSIVSHSQGRVRFVGAGNPPALSGRTMAALSALIALVGTFILLTSAGNEAAWGRCAARGFSVKPVSLVDALLYGGAPLGRADAVTLEFIAPAVGRAMPNLSGSRVMYLGKSDGFVLLYDPADRHSGSFDGPGAYAGVIRLPLDAVALLPTPDADAPAGCPPPPG